MEKIGIISAIGFWTVLFVFLYIKVWIRRKKYVK